MGDLKRPGLIYLKGFLFLGIGVVASVLLIARMPCVQNIVLLILAVWAFCRFYYFAFYVITHYIDDSYRFAGLLSFAQYLLAKRRKSARE